MSDYVFPRLQKVSVDFGYPLILDQPLNFTYVQHHLGHAQIYPQAAGGRF